ncbi:MAG: helix-turn-helix domain-containing protein [Desulfovermiculus sp.]|nr:helix-turn-helix domain-containing protein [Desulfovermiculus sp.]
MFTDAQNSNIKKLVPDETWDTKDIMTVAEVAKLLRVHRSTVTRYAMSGEIVSYKIGSRRLFRAADVWAFFDNKRVCTRRSDGEMESCYSI